MPLFRVTVDEGHPLQEPCKQGARVKHRRGVLEHCCSCRHGRGGRHAGSPGHQPNKAITFQQPPKQTWLLTCPPVEALPRHSVAQRVHITDLNSSFGSHIIIMLIRLNGAIPCGYNSTGIVMVQGRLQRPTDSLTITTPESTSNSLKVMSPPSSATAGRIRVSSSSLIMATTWPTHK